jgi:sedoheptulokinase
MMLIGLDIGTTSLCGVLLNAENMEILKMVTIGNESILKSVHPWEAIQDPEAINRSLRDVLAQLLPEEGSIGAIGITGFSERFVCFLRTEGKRGKASKRDCTIA